MRQFLGGTDTQGYGGMKKIVVLKCTLLVLLMVMIEAPGSDRLNVGSPFPELALPAIEGDRALSIGDFRGKKLILHVWASW
jgi:hypothetical protein